MPNIHADSRVGPSVHDDSDAFSEVYSYELGSRRKPRRDPADWPDLTVSGQEILDALKTGEREQLWEELMEAKDDTEGTSDTPVSRLGRLWLTRHAEAYHNVSKSERGDHPVRDSTLTETGKTQGLTKDGKICTLFKSGYAKFIAVITSPLHRARETATTVFKNNISKDTPMIVLESAVEVLTKSMLHIRRPRVTDQDTDPTIEDHFIVVGDKDKRSIDPRAGVQTPEDRFQVHERVLDMLEQVVKIHQILTEIEAWKAQKQGVASTRAKRDDIALVSHGNLLQTHFFDRFMPDEFHAAFKNAGIRAINYTAETRGSVLDPNWSATISFTGAPELDI